MVALASPAAVAQSLVFESLPAESRVGGRSEAVSVMRLRADGQPDTTGTTQVTVSADSPQAQVSVDAEPWGAWGPTAQLSIAPGGSSTAKFFVRDGRPGVTTWTATASGTTSALQPMTVRTDAVTCGFETGTTLDTDTPPGCFNTLYAPYPVSSVTASMAAARRGTWGLRLIDGEGGLGDASDTALYEDGAPIFGAYYARAWVRLVSSNFLGGAIVLQLTNTAVQSPSLVDVRVAMDTGRLDVGGFDVNAQYALAVGDAGLSRGQWHLVELAATGVGQRDGGRELWLDGQSVAAERHVDFSGATLFVGRLAVGQPYASDRRWLGTLDFDDVRSAVVPLASRLSLAPVGAAYVGECVPVTVRLVDTPTGQPAAAPEAFVARVTVPGDAGVFAEGSCVGVDVGVAFARGATEATFGLRPAAALTTVDVAADDFLGARRVYAFDEPPPLGLAPSAGVVEPGAVVDLVVTGGTQRGLGFFTTLPSGGALVGQRYAAGATTGVEDVIVVRDSSGRTAEARFTVVAPDAGAVEEDAGLAGDAGVESDAGVAPDAGSTVDAGVVTDGGLGPPQRLGVGCGCAAMTDGLFVLAAALLLRARGARRLVRLMR